MSKFKDALMGDNAEDIVRTIETMVNSFSIPCKEVVSEVTEDNDLKARFIELAGYWIDECGKLTDSKYMYDDRNKVAVNLCANIRNSAFVKGVVSNDETSFTKIAMEAAGVDRKGFHGYGRSFKNMHRTLQQSWTGVCLRVLDALSDTDPVIGEIVKEYREERGEKWYRLPLI